MKILKFLLVVFLLFLMVALGSIVFSNRIISYMTETKHSKFENLKYLIKKNILIISVVFTTRTTVILTPCVTLSGWIAIDVCKVLRTNYFGCEPEML